MGKVRIAIVGVGNCASSLVQGLEYYKDAEEGVRVPGLMHVRFGPYHISDLEVVAAFDVDIKKVGSDLSEAINASENNTIKIAEVPSTGVIVQRGPTMDGLGEYYREIITESDEPPSTSPRHSATAAPTCSSAISRSARRMRPSSTPSAPSTRTWRS